MNNATLSLPHGHRKSSILSSRLANLRWIKKNEDESVPAISLKCKLCQSDVPTSQLKQHKMIHLAYKYLKYRGTSKPENLKSLQKRRKSLIKKLRRFYNDKEDPEYDRKLTKINWAYELIKSTFSDVHYQARVVTPIKKEHLLNDNNVILVKSDLSAAIYHEQNNKEHSPKLEKVTVALNYDFGNQFGTNCYYYGMHSGYHGHQAVEEAKAKLHQFVANELIKEEFNTAISSLSLDASKSKTDDLVRSEGDDEMINTFSNSVSPDRATSMLSVDQPIRQLTYSVLKRKRTRNDLEDYLLSVAKAFRRAYASFDADLKRGIKEKSAVRWSGCSSATCLLNFNPAISKSGILHFANVGDIKGILCRGDTGYVLSRKHTASNAKERTRVLRSGCSIKSLSSTSGLINGVLHITRGFGSHGDPLLKSAIISTPHVTSLNLTDEDKFLILASNNLWDVIDEKAAVEMLLQMHPFRNVENHISNYPKDNNLATGIQHDQDATTEVLSQLDNPKFTKINTPVEDYSGIVYNYNSKINEAVGKNELPSLANQTKYDSNNNNSSLLSKRAPQSANSIIRPTLQDSRRLSYDYYDHNASFTHTTVKEFGKEAKTSSLVAESPSELLNDNIHSNEETKVFYSDASSVMIIDNERLVTSAEMQPFPKASPAQKDVLANLSKAMVDRLARSALHANCKGNLNIMIILLPGFYKTIS